MTKKIISLVLILATLFSIGVVSMSTNAVSNNTKVNNTESKINTPVISTSSTEYPGYVNTKSDPLALRSSPNTYTWYTVIAWMPKGSNVTVLDNKQTYNGFYRVRYNGRIGYAYASYIGFYAQSIITHEGYVNTNRDPLALRSSSNTWSTVLAWMPKGSRVTVLDNKKIYNGFYHVQYNGRTGYAYAIYIAFIAQNNSGGVSLNVPLYKQNDSRWANVYIGTKTIGQVGCLTTSLAMMYSYNNNITCYPDAMKNKLSYCNNDLYWSSLANIGMTSRQYGCYINNDIMKTIYDILKSGKPVTIGCNGTNNRGMHWVVITGYNGNTTNFSTSNFTINDPGSANDQTLSAFLNNRGTICRIIW